MKEKRFVIVIPSYNNKQWCNKNILSVLNQNYSNYKIIYTDDCSSDGTVTEVEKLFFGKNNCILIKNTERLGAMNNMYNMVHSCDDDEIIIVLDGDDWLANVEVLNRLNKEYNKENIFITYGQYRSFPDNKLGCSRPIPKYIIDNNSYRKFHWCSSHLRTYYAWLFKKINKEDFMENGKFFDMTSDLAAMFPMLEMAGINQSFISDVLYIYNCESEINDSKVDRIRQIYLEKKIRASKPYNILKEF
jgi:glycosyltransferase involved in cell wall biosynthesis